MKADQSSRQSLDCLFPNDPPGPTKTSCLGRGVERLDQLIGLDDLVQPFDPRPAGLGLRATDPRRFGDQYETSKIWLYGEAQALRCRYEPLRERVVQHRDVLSVLLDWGADPERSPAIEPNPLAEVVDGYAFSEVLALARPRWSRADR